MSQPFVGTPWDDREWYRSSRWDERIAEEFERRLLRARPGSRAQYVAIQGGHLTAQPDPRLRELGRRLLRRAIAMGDFNAKNASEQLAASLAAEGLLDEAIEAHRETLTLIAASSDGFNFTSGQPELPFAEVLLRRGSDADVAEARRVLDAFDQRGPNALGPFASTSIRYLLVRADVHRASGEIEIAGEYLSAAARRAEAPAIPVRPLPERELVDGVPAEHLSRIVASVAPVMKSAGFKKRRHSFNRLAGDGLIHVLSFQAGASDPPRPEGEASVLPSYHGKFTVNLAVRVPGMRDMGGAGSWTNEYQGHLRMRLGALADAEDRDVWWETLHPGSADDVAAVIREIGLPWLDQFEDADSVLDAWRSLGVHAPGVPFPLDIACLMVSRGLDDEAEEVLRAYIAEGVTPHHLTYLREFLPTIGMGHVVADSAT